MLKWIKDNIDTSISTHVQIKNNWTFLHYKKLLEIKNINSKIIYNILVDRKSERNYMEHAWERIFNLDNIKWDGIYNNQVWEIKDKKLGEFKYKLLCYIVCTRSVISKWNKNISDKCTFCNETQNVRHLIYECPRSKNIWILIGTILKLEIQYKHLILGNIVTNETIRCRNLLISYVTYAIYKFWILSENQKIDFNHASMVSFVKKDLFRRSLYLKDKEFCILCDKVIKGM